MSDEKPALHNEQHDDERFAPTTQRQNESDDPQNGRN